MDFKYPVLFITFILLAFFLGLFWIRRKTVNGNHQADLTKLRNDISELEKEISTLKEKNKALRTEIYNLTHAKQTNNEVVGVACGQNQVTLETDNKKLAKRIRILENELKESEKEQTKLEEQEKKLKIQKRDVQNKLDDACQRNKRLENSLDLVKKECRKHSERLEQKTKSLEFVQSILSAPETGAKDIKATYRAIDLFESFLKGQFMDCIALLFNTFPDAVFNNARGSEGFKEKKASVIQSFNEWASVKRKNWLDRKTTIAFVGEFNAGKTTIVNRILSQDDPSILQMPVSGKPTTAIPTYIVGGVAETYNFASPDDKVKAINEEAFRKVSKEVLDEIQGVSSLIKYFVMTYKNPALDGLSILDTPGFSSNDDEDKTRTIEVINECDALFWVFDVNNGGINRSSASIIKENLKKPLFIVINKIDSVSPSQIEEVRRHITQTLADEGLKINGVIQFSNTSPLSRIMDPVHSIRRDEGRDSFISLVESDITRWEAMVSTKVREASTEYQRCRTKVEHVAADFSSNYTALKNACSDAAEIPHWESYLFRKDRFEMTETEGRRLLELLDEIESSRCPSLESSFNCEKSAVAEMQNAYIKMTELKAVWQKIDDCLREFKKLSIQLK